MNTRRPFDTGCNQGRDSEESLRASRLALGMDPDADPMESSTVRWIAALLAVIALFAAMDRLGIDMLWPL